MKRLILNIYPGIQTHTEVSHLPFITPLSRESRGIWWTEPKYLPAQEKIFLFLRECREQFEELADKYDRLEVID